MSGKGQDGRLIVALGLLFRRESECDLWNRRSGFVEPAHSHLPRGPMIAYSCSVQRSRSAPAATRMLPVLSPVLDARLEIDAEAFSAALEALARIYELQDPRRTCTYGLTLTECYALESLIRRGPLTVKSAATELMVDKGTASRALAGLARKGYALRGEDPRDKRVVEVSANAAGERLYRTIRSASRRLHRDLLAEVSPGVRRAATTLLRRIAAAEAACASARCEPST
jgi:MarR family 2-MHQ and catechol resistance regulon transcriptional repressor